MHELSVAQGIVNSIDKRKRNLSFTRLKRVLVACGKYNCLSESCLQFCFEACEKPAYMEGAKIKLSRVDSLVRCLDCGVETPIEGATVQRCAACGSERTEIAFNHSVFITSLEVE